MRAIGVARVAREVSRGGRPWCRVTVATRLYRVTVDFPGPCPAEPGEAIRTARTLAQAAIRELEAAQG